MFYNLSILYGVILSFVLCDCAYTNLVFIIYCIAIYSFLVVLESYRAIVRAHLYICVSVSYFHTFQNQTFFNIYQALRKSELAYRKVTWVTFLHAKQCGKVSWCADK